VLAHYTVEFLYAERTSSHPLADVSSFALRKEASNCQWAKLVINTALLTTATEESDPDANLSEYRIWAARDIIIVWEQALAKSGLEDLCLDYFNPAGSHFSHQQFFRTNSLFDLLHQLFSSKSPNPP
jgi:hypothetical protein